MTSHPEIYPEAFGVMLREMREEAGWIQMWLARKIDVEDQRLISHWENGRVTGRRKLSRVKGIELAEVLVGEVSHLKRPADVVNWLSLIGIRPTEKELDGMSTGKTWQQGIRLAWVSRYQVPPLPQPHVERRDLMDQAKRYLLEEAGGNIPLVLVGLPGAGKSTLVAALAADPEVRGALPHAVLWAQLDELTSDSGCVLLASVLRRWYQAWGFDPSGKTKEELLKWLDLWVRYERVLIVIDNVTRFKEIEPLLLGGSECRVIITTRDRGLMRYLPGGSLMIEVGCLEQEEAGQLLEGLVRDTSDRMVSTVREEVVDLLGGNALALTLVGKEASVRGLGAVLAYLRDPDARWLQVLSREGEEDPNRSVAVSFSLSYERLDEEGRRCYRALGQLPGASRFTVEIFQAVAGLSGQSHEAQALLDGFVERSLLQLDGRGYRLHPLLYEYTHRLLKEVGEWDGAHGWIQAYRGGLVEAWRRWRVSVPRPPGVSFQDAGGLEAWIRAGWQEFRTFRPALRSLRRRSYDETLATSWDPRDVPLDRWIVLKRLQRRYRLYLGRLWWLAAALGGWIGLLVLLYLLAYIPSLRPWLFRRRLTILYLSSVIPLVCLILPLWLGTVHLIDLHRLWNWE